MDRLTYLERHHEITEKYIGLARMYLDCGDVDTAKEFLAKCVKEIDAVFDERIKTIQEDKKINLLLD
jgi:Tfp pilus assembly protein PilF